MVFLHREIALCYLKGWFLFDFLSILPLEIFLNSESPYSQVNQFMKMARLTKLKNLVRFFRLAKIMRICKRQSQRKAKDFVRMQQGLGRIYYFVVFLIIVSHLLTCGYLFFALFDERNWLTEMVAGLEGAGETITMVNLEETPLSSAHWQYYLLSLYRMMQTITTVGYGDINPVNSKERIYTVFVMIVGVVCFAFISGSVASILQSYDEESTKVSEIESRVW